MARWLLVVGASLLLACVTRLDHPSLDGAAADARPAPVDGAHRDEPPVGDPSTDAGRDAADARRPDGAIDAGTPDARRPAPACPLPAELPASPPRRLTSEQLRRAIDELTGVRLDRPLPAERRNEHGFEDDPAVQDNGPEVVKAELAQAAVVSSDMVAHLASFAPCPSAELSTCGKRFVDGFGRRAFRRPLEDGERARLVALFEAVLAKTDFATAIQVTAHAILASPPFLFRLELGPPALAAASHVPLTDFELATRLAILLWGSVPDAALLDAAEAGALGTDDGLAAQIARMLADPRATGGIEDYHRQWLGFDRVTATSHDGTRFPDWSSELATDLRDEAIRFVSGRAFDSPGTLADLLTSRRTFVTSRLAKLYGVQPPSIGWAAATLPDAQRAGLFTLGWFAATYAEPTRTSITRRGSFVTDKLFCQAVPPPPANLNTALSDVPNMTGRQELEQAIASPVCKACHALTDPPGFAFEPYDAIGRFRTTDDGLPIDAKGELRAPDAMIAFDDARDLMARLASSGAVSRCYAETWLTYALGRDPHELDTCLPDRIVRAFDASGGRITTLLATLAAAPELHVRRGPVPPPPAAPSSPPAITVASSDDRAIKKALLDVLVQAYAETAMRLPADERAPLEQTLTGLRELERTLAL